MMQEFVQSVKDTAQKAVDNVHTAVPASITAFDASNGLATVQPKAKYKKPNGETMDYPSVSGVPVVFPQSKNTTIAFPIKAGDDCLLVFSETAIDYWLYGKETSTDLKHDLSSAIAVPNISTTGNDAMQKACDEDAVVIQAGETEIVVSSEGVEITGNLTVNGEVTVNDKVTVTDTVTADGEVTGNGIALSTHTHGCPEGGTTTSPR